MTYDMNILGDLRDPMPDLSMGSTGTLITGAVKLAQKVLVMLLTDKETDSMGRGTRIPGLLMGASNLDLGQLEGILVIALGDVKDQLDATYLPGTPDDERLTGSKAFLEVIEADWVKVTIAITTASGESTTIQIPKTLTQLQKEAS
jgi:hypothetical protein